MREYDTQEDRDNNEQREREQADRKCAEQAEMRRRYLEQLQRMGCPGCGEEPFAD